MLGETTRAQNFGLNGYARDTTPKLRALQPVYFANTVSCGTSTAVSVPCIFSGLTREHFSTAKARASETLVDVVLHAGTPVIWRDNDGGCKGVCLNADVEDLNNSQDPKFCSGNGQCVDEILLAGLKDKIDTHSKDLFVVLHLKGSHGPAYWKRYPKEFALFQPSCQSTDLSLCSADEIRNAYDNTVLYTDHIVASTVELLKTYAKRRATALFYVSDHGESLGENGMYLHGLPYAMAPDTQTRVPMLAWISREFLSLEKWDASCVRKTSELARSHDHVFHTLLGLLEIGTGAYNPALDIFAKCDDD